SADIVDQHIDTTEAAKAGLHHDFDRGGDRDVALVGDNLAAGCRHALDGLRHAVEIAVDRENFRSFFSEAHRRCAPVAPAGTDAASTCDNRDAALQTSAHAFAPVRWRAGAKR